MKKYGIQLCAYNHNEENLKLDKSLIEIYVKKYKKTMLCLEN